MSTGMKGERRINTILEDPGTGKAGEENMEREVLLRPIKVLKRSDRRIGIFQKGWARSDAYFLLEFGEEEIPRCYTIDHPSLKLAEREVKSLLTENEDIVSGKDSGLCSSCEGGIMENCDDFKTNRVGETITGRRGVKKC
ncbi:MAG: hypothetical protein V5A88_04130 [Candidatus Thermoplasmatota archaeon]